MDFWIHIVVAGTFESYKSLVMLSRAHYKLITQSPAAEDWFNSKVNHLWSLIKLIGADKFDESAVTVNPYTTEKHLRYTTLRERIFGKVGIRDDLRPHNPNYYTLGEYISPSSPSIYTHAPLHMIPDHTEYSHMIIYNRHVTLDLIELNPILLSHPNISFNPNITWDFIQAHPKCNWDWDAVSLHSNITMDIIEANPDKFKCKKCIAFNPNVTLEWAINNPDYANWEIVSGNIDWDSMINSGRICMYGASWREISKYVKWKTIHDNPDLPWDYDGVSANPNITCKIVYRNINLPWNWKEMSKNRFGQKTGQT